MTFLFNLLIFKMLVITNQWIVIWKVLLSDEIFKIKIKQKKRKIKLRLIYKKLMN